MRFLVTMTMEILSPPGLNIARLVPRQKKPCRDCLPQGLDVWAGVPQFAISDLPH